MLGNYSDFMIKILPVTSSKVKMMSKRSCTKILQDFIKAEKAVNEALHGLWNKQFTDFKKKAHLQPYEKLVIEGIGILHGKKELIHRIMTTSYPKHPNFQQDSG